MKSAKKKKNIISHSKILSEMKNVEISICWFFEFNFFYELSDIFGLPIFICKPGFLGGWGEERCIWDWVHASLQQLSLGCWLQEPRHRARAHLDLQLIIVYDI